MIFTEGRFFLLFALTFALYWSLTSNAARKHVLLLASCVFYGAWDWRFLGLMFASITLDWALGLALNSRAEVSDTRHERLRRAWITASVVANLAILSVFKYYGFFVDSAARLLESIGLHLGTGTLEIVLPVGISFYTFQSLSYTIDVYRRHMPAVRSYTDFALFVSFFPQLVAGPIVRAVDFIPQLAGPRRWKDVDVWAALSLFLVGFAKKACIADAIAPIVDPVFADPAFWDHPSRGIALVLYHVQIYCDFSGYSDMAIATAALFGYRLTKNFDLPYLATSISEWWRRWHISLSSWFRDYLYVPLGGNRRGPARTYLNLALVFVLCGLWHGASWNFVVWGAYHGALLVGQRVLAPVSARLRMPPAVGWLLTTCAALLGWLVFRGEGLEKTRLMFEGLLGIGTPGAAAVSRAWLVLPIVLLGLHAAARSGRAGAWIAGRPGWQRALGYGVASALVLAFAARGHQPFIYFQF